MNTRTVDPRTVWAILAMEAGLVLVLMGCGGVLSWGAAAVSACERSIQVHGGTGFTWEHPLHRYYKRALWLEGALGYGREQRAEVAASLLSAGRP